jgi:catechol 2,3-dioxygenase-like lactoylglutathione lyase family enzyme
MKFHSVSLSTSELPKQLEFYQNRLGLPVLEQSNTSVVFQVGASKLEFVQDTLGNAFYHFAFNIPSHQFAEAKVWLSNRVELIKDTSGKDEFHTDNWNADNVYFYDAGGNVAELIARHDLKSDVRKPFSVKSLECISELGIVTDDVPKTVEAIQAKLPVTLYRATLNDMFVPMGDETGLVIVVKRDRIWFPETKAAVVAPFTVAVSEINNQPLSLSNASLGLVDKL